MWNDTKKRTELSENLTKYIIYNNVSGNGVVANLNINNGMQGIFFSIDENSSWSSSLMN